MIVTVSLNPAIDKYLRLPRLQRGRHQQASEVITSAGGKAINVAGVLRALGEQVRLIGFFGGVAGEFLLRQIADEGVEADAVPIASSTRTAFVMVEDSGVETEVVEPGGAVTVTEIEELRRRLRRAARSADVIVLSGSVPPGCATDIYVRLLEDCGESRSGCPVLLDTSREWLRAVVRNRRGPYPTLVKPNRREAEDLLEMELRRPADFLGALDRLGEAGIANPVISAGSNGLYAACEGEVVRVTPPSVRAVNSVGSGDAAIAGLATGFARGLRLEDSLRLAAACGTANVLTKECAQVLAADVQRLLPEVRVSRVVRARKRRYARNVT